MRERILTLGHAIELAKATEASNNDSNTCFHDYRHGALPSVIFGLKGWMAGGLETRDEEAREHHSQKAYWRCRWDM